MDRGLHLALEAVGTRYRLAKLLGLTASAVQKWRNIPTHQIVNVEAVTGVSRTKLRPELYDGMTQKKRPSK